MATKITLRKRQIPNDLLRYFKLKKTDRWCLRTKIIWVKGMSFAEHTCNHCGQITKYSGSCMPDSAKDRPNKNGFEYIYHFVKSKKYWYEQQYEDYAEPERDGTTESNSYSFGEHGKTYEYTRDYSGHGRIIRNVWAINPQPTSDGHYATYPDELVEKCIKMGCPKEICKKCGKPREAIIIKEKPPKELFTKHSNPDDGYVHTGTTIDGERKGCGQKLQKWLNEHPPKITYSDCGCGAGFEAGIVFDPFSGTATTLKVAARLGYRYLGIELKPEYIEKYAKPNLKEAETGIPRQELKAGQKGLYDGMDT